MVTKIHLDSLRSEVFEIQRLIETVDQRDILTSLSLRQRLLSLQEQLAAEEQDAGTAAEIALVFDGGPVFGSSAIDAAFAGKALQEYQELITKQVAIDGVGLAQKGPVPVEMRDVARMQVTDLVHGSFGFVLQETTADEPEFFESPVKVAMTKVSDLLAAVAARDPKLFDDQLDHLDLRMFASLKKFFSNLHKSNASLKLSERTREISLGNSDVSVAFARLQEVDVSESQEVVRGNLLGLVPIQRLFEFRRLDTGEIIKGRVSQMFSEGYLDRIEKEGLVAGKEWQASILTRLIEHPDGRHATIKNFLLDLIEI
jgi:hypothetical protein